MWSIERVPPKRGLPPLERKKATGLNAERPIQGSPMTYRCTGMALLRSMQRQRKPEAGTGNIARSDSSCANQPLHCSNHGSNSRTFPDHESERNIQKEVLDDLGPWKQQSYVGTISFVESEQNTEKAVRDELIVGGKLANDQRTVVKEVLVAVTPVNGEDSKVDFQEFHRPVSIANEVVPACMKFFMKQTAKAHACH